MVDQQNRSELPVIRSDGTDFKGSEPKSGRGRLRACVLILVHVVIVLHITHYHFAGRSVSPVEPSEAMYALELGYINAGLIFFMIAIAATAIFGRFFCGWGCHIVALQDLCSYLLRKVGVRIKPLRSRMLALTPFVVAFYMFFLPTVQRLMAGEPHPGFSNHLMTENFWQTFPGPAITILTFVVCGGLVVYLLGNKGFCTYACPYGAFFYVADQVAPGRIRVTDACKHCGQCTAACTSNVAVSKEVKEFGMVVDPGCMKCMDCVSVCPNDALYFGFKPTVETKEGYRKKNYDYSIGEDIVGLCIVAFSVIAFRGLYEVVPFLLAVALGVITAFLAIQCGRMFQRRDLRIQQFQLKRNGQMTRLGYAFLILMSAWFAFNIHSFFVQFHRYRGIYHYNQIEVVVEELFLAGPRPYTPEEIARIEAAFSSFDYSDRYGLANVYDVKVGLAATAMMKKDVERATEYLYQAHELRPGPVKDLLVEFLGIQGRMEEAKELANDK